MSTARESHRAGVSPNSSKGGDVGLTGAYTGRYFGEWRGRLVSPRASAYVARYRLRFLLQEMDLGPARP